MKKLRLNELIFSTLLFIFTLDFKLSESKSVKQSDERCREGYFLHTDELCYPKVRKPCPFETQTTYTTTTTATPAIRAPKSLLHIKRLECPYGSVMMREKCHKIICSLGEYYKGTCLQPVCPQGLVWGGKMCQKPAYLTTIIEIDNVIVNEVIEKPIAVSKSYINKVVYHASTTNYNPDYINRSLLFTTTTSKPEYSMSTTSNKLNVTNHQYSRGCCKVFTPRICKLYGDKWLCFNRKYERCDSYVCKAPVVYLKAPEIKFEAPLLIMPPNPKLNVCESCQNNSDVVDCSGCASYISGTCSTHCYRYICPNDSCAFMDLYEYCSNYSGRDGCSPTDGCLWKWCQV